MKNSSNIQDKSPENTAIIENDIAPPAPQSRARIKLQSVGDVSHELAKLYREARNKKIDVADASRLANMLSILSRILESSELEKRIEILERRGALH
ncbi:MAG: hypothetical protein ACREPB_00305 [Arenimonas sp.]